MVVSGPINVRLETFYRLVVVDHRIPLYRSRRGKQMIAHRGAWELANGRLPRPCWAVNFSRPTQICVMRVTQGWRGTTRQGAAARSRESSSSCRRSRWDRRHGRERDGAIARWGPQRRSWFHSAAMSDWREMLGEGSRLVSQSRRSDRVPRITAPDPGALSGEAVEVRRASRSTTHRL